MALDFKAIFAGAPVPAMVLNKEYRFVAANAAYLKMTGKTEADLIDRYVFDAFPEEPERVKRMLAVFRETLEGGTPVFEEIPFVIERDGAREERWFNAQHAPLRGTSGEIKYMVQYSQDVTEKVRLKIMRDAVMREMQHRIGNLFTVVNAVARRVARTAEDVPGFLADFEARLHDLHRAQKELGNGSGQARDIRSVIAEQLDVFVSHARGRMTEEGPDVSLSPDEARALSMALHELSTNSLKYGAIGQPDGRVAVSWRETSGGLEFVWEETGLESAPDGTRSGYGTHLLMRVLPAQMDGHADRVFEDQRLRYALTISRPEAGCEKRL